ncbi:MAG: zinc-dependent metalloprotease [Bacteroidota bacterium]
MKKILLAFFVCGAAVSQAQTTHRCYSKEAIDHQEALTPGYRDQVNNQFEIAKQWSQNHLPTRSLYVVPVVFHVVYNTPEENISDEILQNQIDILNEDYARMNADSGNIRPEFQPVVGATNIRFQLAQTDPDGNPTTGITRTETTMETFGTLFLDFDILEKVKSTANGGIDPWDQSRYLNIWVCDMSIDFLGEQLAMLLGYATPPDGLPNWPAGSTDGMSDGVVLQYHTVGDNEHNPNDIAPDSHGRTAVHEVGHYLGLRHIWGDGDCTEDDGVDDTPDATDASSQDCNMTINSCSADVVGLGDLHDMVENFMDYSAESCQNSFTRHQTDLMHGVLENERYDLVHSNPVLGLQELPAIAFEAYPNPAASYVKVKAKNQISGMEIHDLNGRLLADKKVNANDSVISVDSFESGTYILSVYFSNGQTAQKRISKR